MLVDPYPETDPDEIQSSRVILLLLERVANLSAELDKHIDVAPGSRLAADDARTPHQSVSTYAFAQLMAALGCLEALGMMGVREDDKQVSLTLSPFGAYALIRNALDAAATAMWLLEPESSTLRIKRRLLLSVDEAKNSVSFQRSMDRPDWSKRKDAKEARVREIAVSANLNGWDPFKERLPTMTSILLSLERHHKGAVMPWLPAWQLASGHAHAKLWAHTGSQQLDEQNETRTDTGATFRVSIKYSILALLLRETVELAASAEARFVALATK